MISIKNKIYRGFKEYLNDGMHKNIFRIKSRKPIDTNRNMHALADIWFNDNFGIFARSQTIICSTDINQATQYKSETGSIAHISIDGSYKIIYSENVKDFLDYATEIEEISPKNVAGWLQNKNYQCINNINLMPMGFRGEIMIDCEEFYIQNLKI